MSETDWAALQREAARRFGVRRFRPGQRELIEAVLGGRDAAGHPPHRRRQVAHLPASRALPPSCGGGRLPAALADPGPAGKAQAARIEVARWTRRSRPAEQRDDRRGDRRGRQRPHLRHAGTAGEPRVPLRCCASAASRSWWWTRRTASRSGATTSGPRTWCSPRRSRALGRPPILALTATATPEVLDDIVRQLGMKIRRWSTRGVRPAEPLHSRCAAPSTAREGAGAARAAPRRRGAGSSTARR